MGSLGRLDTGSTPHTPAPSSGTSASARQPLKHLLWGPGLPGAHPDMTRRGSQQPPSQHPPIPAPGFPHWWACAVLDGLQQESSGEHSHTQRRAQQVFQVCPSDTTTKKFLAIMTVYNQDTSLGWHPNTFSRTPISTSCHHGSKYKLPVSRLFILP